MHTPQNFYRIFTKEWVSFGRTHAKKYLGKFLQIGLIYMAAQIVVALVTPGEEEPINIMHIISPIVSIIVTAWFTVGLTHILLNVVDGHKISLNHFVIKSRAQRNMLARWVGGYIAMMIVAAWPLIIVWVAIWFIVSTESAATMDAAWPMIQALGVGGSIVAGLLAVAALFYTIHNALRLSFWQYYMIDKNLMIKESLRASRTVTKGHVWELVGTGFISFAISLLGMLCLFIGLLRAIPVVVIAMAYLYRKISSPDNIVHNS